MFDFRSADDAVKKLFEESDYDRTSYPQDAFAERSRSEYVKTSSLDNDIIRLSLTEADPPSE